MRWIELMFARDNARIITKFISPGDMIPGPHFLPIHQMNADRLRDSLAYVTVASLALFLTAATLYGLLARLGDDSGSWCAWWIVVIGASGALISTSVVSLAGSGDIRRRFDEAGCEDSAGETP